MALNASPHRALGRGPVKQTNGDRPWASWPEAGLIYPGGTAGDYYLAVWLHSGTREGLPREGGSVSFTDPRLAILKSGRSQLYYAKDGYHVLSLREAFEKKRKTC